MRCRICHVGRTTCAGFFVAVSWIGQGHWGRSDSARFAGYVETAFAWGVLARLVDKSLPSRSSREARAKAGWVFGTISATGSSVRRDL